MSQPRTRPIIDVAADLDLRPEHLTLYGHDKAKVALDARASGRPAGRLVLVSAITPTDAGEGKTTTSIGLAQGLARIGQRVCLTLREPSLGPTFGKKGGATGGGLSTVVPETDINLHFTGDFHAIGAAHNLLAALLDNHLHHRNPLGIDPRRIVWRRVMDMNDRALRHIVVGLGGVLDGVPRQAGFDITPASEVMAALCLARDADDLRQRLSRIIVGLSYDNRAVTAGDLKAVGAMLVLLNDALRPNLVQTREGVPALIHGGPFGNIAHGCNSVIATTMALARADWVVTEAGFGFDLGGEKFFDIKCPAGGLNATAVVVVATVRALKLHGGGDKRNLTAPDPAQVEAGVCNLEKQVENARAFGAAPIVALNRFATDTDEEIAVVRQASEHLGAPFAVSDIFARGGAGGTDLAELVVSHATSDVGPVRPLYDAADSIVAKVERVAKTMYGARDVIWTPVAERALSELSRLGLDALPVCIAKTQKSLSDDPRLLGRPRDFAVTVRDILAAAGAGFVVPLLGDIMRMPGLPASPQAERMDVIDGKMKGVVAD